MNHLARRSLVPVVGLAFAVAIATLSAAPAAAQSLTPAAEAVRPAVTAADAAPAPTDPIATREAGRSGRRLGVHVELDLGTTFVLRQGAGIAGGVTWGPFRAGLSYATFLSNARFGGTPDGFTMRANYIIGVNASYFIARSSDDGLYVQGMFHIKQQGVTNDGTGDHVDLNSLAAGVELGYVWKPYRGMYVAPRVGALYYVDKPQPGNRPVTVGDRAYDNDRHKDWDTYFIPTLSLGYSWK